MRFSSYCGFLVAVLALTLFAPSAFGQTNIFTEDFEGWNTGGIHAQGTCPDADSWCGWDNDIAFDASVGTGTVLNGLQSLSILAGSDIVREHAFTQGPGLYEYRANVFIPVGSTGNSWFIILNTYAAGGAKNWSVQVVFNSDTLTIDSMGGSGTATPGQLPLTQGVWYAIRVEINLNQNTHNIFLDDGTGELQLNDNDDEDYQSTGTLAVAAVDLFSESQGGAMQGQVFYDDIEVDYTPCGHITTSGLACDLDPVTNEVSATFSPNDTYDEVQVTRNGNVIQTLPGPFPDSFSDFPPPGDHEYGLISVVGGESCNSGEVCNISIPFPAAGPPCDPGDFITQSISQDIVSGTSVSCQAGGVISDNGFWRTFQLSDFTLPSQFDITHVEVGTEFSNPGEGFLTQPATIRIYEDFDVDPAPVANLTLLHEQVVGIEHFEDGPLCFQLDTPLTITSETHLAVEIFVDDATTGAGHAFFIASNPGGSANGALTYLSSVGCGFPEPSDIAGIGFPDMHMLMNLYYEGQLGQPFIRGDVDGSGGVNALVDSLFLLAFGFQGGDPPPAPHPACGVQAGADCAGQGMPPTCP